MDLPKQDRPSHQSHGFVHRSVCRPIFLYLKGFCMAEFSSNESGSGPDKAPAPAEWTGGSSCQEEHEAGTRSNEGHAVHVGNVSREVQCIGCSVRHVSTVIRSFVIDNMGRVWESWSVYPWCPLHRVGAHAPYACAACCGHEQRQRLLCRA